MFPIARGASCYDAGRGCTVLFNELLETWEYDGSTWTQRHPSVSPPTRYWNGMVYEAARGRVLLVGGSPTLTWEYDGSNWTRLNVSGPECGYLAMAYDEARGRTVLFAYLINGGFPIPATWEFDGATWTQMSPIVTPGLRQGYSMVFDARSGRTVMFGGQATFYGLLNETWEYDGANWLQVTPAVSPSGRADQAMVFDSARGRTLLFGGADGNGNYIPDMWEYDSTIRTWTSLNAPVAPSPRVQHVMVYDSTRHRTIVYGGASTLDSPAKDLWEYDGIAWTQRSSPPPSRAWLAMTYDAARGLSVLFGNRSLADPATTWEYDGRIWTMRNPGVSPPPRDQHRMVYDTARGRTVLFGGVGASALLADTWEYDGATWILMTPGVSPPPLFGRAMSYDVARRRTVLAGGDGLPSETWEYDGATWTRINTPVAPGSCGLPAMAYDVARCRTVLFGGYDQNYSVLADTWEYDGNSWTRQSPAASPPGRVLHGMVYDSVRGRTVMMGGWNGHYAGDLGDTWEYDGTTWQQLSFATPIPPRQGHAMAYDGARGRTVMTGGYAETFFIGEDTRELVLPPTPTFTRHGLGCSGATGTPSLDTVGGAVPGLGTAFPLQIAGLSAQASFVYLVFGFDLAHWSAATLPFPMAVFGLPSCQLWVAPEIGALLPTNNGVAALSLTIPADPVLSGVTVGAQAMTFDAQTFSGLGAVSNGVILGVR